MPSCFPYVLPRTCPSMYFHSPLQGADDASAIDNPDILVKYFPSLWVCQQVSQGHAILSDFPAWASCRRCRQGERSDANCSDSPAGFTKILNKHGANASALKAKMKKRHGGIWVKWPWMSINRAAAVKCCKFHSESCGYLSRMWNSVVPFLGFVSIWGRSKKETDVYELHRGLNFQLSNPKRLKITS